MGKWPSSSVTSPAPDSPIFGAVSGTAIPAAASVSAEHVKAAPSFVLEPGVHHERPRQVVEVSGRDQEVDERERERHLDA